MIAGWGQVEGEVPLCGQQKGVNTKMRQLRNFGMANPEGYRKALRLMKQAESLDAQLSRSLTLRVPFQVSKQRSAARRSHPPKLLEMARLKVPVICIIIGEGASGGALALGSEIAS